MLVSNLNTEFWAQIDNEESYTDLVMAIEFSEPRRVSLFIAVCDGDRTQAEIINRYTQQLKPQFHHYLVSVDRKHLNVSRAISDLVATSTPLQDRNSSNDPQPERAIVSIVGATALSPFSVAPNSTASERETFFGYLQLQRESFQNFHFPIVLWVSKNIYDLMLSETPDFWSWRNGVFFFGNVAVPSKLGILSTSIYLSERDLDLDRVEEIPIADLEQLIQNVSTRNPEDPLLINLYHRLGEGYSDRLTSGKHDLYSIDRDLAISYFQQAIDLASKTPDRYELDLANSMNRLAILYCDRGKYEAAEPLYLRSLEIRENRLGDNHLDTASSLNNLAALYKLMGRYPDAEPLHARSLAIREERLGANHPDIANSLNNLAGLYESMGRYSEAEPLYVQSLAICEENLGTNHPHPAICLNNLAKLYRRMGRYSEAEPLHARSLAIREEQLGINHPDTATSLNSLAFLYKSMGKYAQAELLYLRSLAIYEEHLGANHPSTATNLNNLAELYKSMGRYGEAEPMYVRSLAIREEQLGANHPDTASSLNNLGGLYLAMGRYLDAEPLLVGALEIVDRALGCNHPTTQTIRNNLQNLRRQLKLLQDEIDP